MGVDFGVVKNKTGELFTYGLNTKGQLGLGDNESRSSLNSLVSLNTQGSVRNMAAGSNFVICLVDEAPTPHQYFCTEIPESAPTGKRASGYPQQTSVTEFKDFDRAEMYAISGSVTNQTSENRNTHKNEIQ